MTGDPRSDRETSREDLDPPMPPRIAIFYVENPIALVRDFPDEGDREAAMAKVDLALSTS